MSLTNNDVKQIGKLLDQRFDDQDKKFDQRFDEQDKKFDQRFDEQDKKFDQRFDEQDKKFSLKLDSQRDKLVECIKAETKIVMARIDRLEERMNTMGIDNRREHQEILAKIELLRNTENEDILAMNKDVDKLEKRVVRLETKVV